MWKKPSPRQDQQSDLSGRERLFVEAYEWIESLVVTTVAVVLMFTFIARTSVVNGYSMEDTLHEGDLLIVSRLLYTPKRGDIIVVTKPTGYDPLVKRVVAMGGQSVDIDFEAGVVTVDGITADEPFIKEETHLHYDVAFPVLVPEGQVFVMGDNRNRSLDSRSTSIGFIDERYILGKAWVRLLPVAKFGSIYP